MNENEIEKGKKENPIHKPPVEIFLSVLIRNSERREPTPSVFISEGKSDTKVMAIAVRDAGGLNAVLPLIPRFQEKGYALLLSTFGVAGERLAASTPKGFVTAAFETLDSLKPDVVIRTAADLRNGGFHALGKQYEDAWRDAVFIDIDDVPGSSASIIAEGRRPADRVFVLDEGAKAIVASQRPEMSPKAIKVTGRADFDSYARTTFKEKATIRQKTREALVVPKGDFLMVFSGQLPPAAETALEKLVSSLDGLSVSKRMTLVYSFHPRAIKEIEKYGEYVIRAREIFNELWVFRHEGEFEWSVGQIFGFNIAEEGF